MTNRAEALESNPWIKKLFNFVDGLKRVRDSIRNKLSATLDEENIHQKIDKFNHHYPYAGVLRLQGLLVEYYNLDTNLALVADERTDCRYIIAINQVRDSSDVKGYNLDTLSKEEKDKKKISTFSEEVTLATEIDFKLKRVSRTYNYYTADRKICVYHEYYRLLQTMLRKK